MSLFRKFAPTIRFASFIGDFSIASPVVEAKRLRPEWMRLQDGRKENRFVNCPGMVDHAQAGYIVTAHVDIHIKANAAGVVVKLGNLPRMTQEERDMLQPAQFNHAIVDGMVSISCAKASYKVPLPYAVFARKGWSAHVLPAPMHSEFLDKLHVYSGIVDYDRYHTINFVFSPIKECEFTIWQGEPLLQVIPFERAEVVAECGKATERERDLHLYGSTTKKKGFFRRFIHARKTYRMRAVA